MQSHSGFLPTSCSSKLYTGAREAIKNGNDGPCTPKEFMQELPGDPGRFLTAETESLEASERKSAAATSTVSTVILTEAAVSQPPRTARISSLVPPVVALRCVIVVTYSRCRWGVSSQRRSGERINKDGKPLAI